MHCIHCGAEIPDNAKFCTVCGKPQNASPAAEQPVFTETAENASEDAEYTAPENASEGYKAANAQLPASYSNPNYSSASSSAYTGPAASSDTNVLAIIGFVCSLVFLPVALGTLSAVAGLVLSILGLNNSKKLPGNKGRGLSIAGIIISGIRIALILIAIFAIFALMIRGAGHVGHEIISNWKDYVPYYH